MNSVRGSMCRLNVISNSERLVYDQKCLIQMSIEKKIEHIKGTAITMKQL